MWEGKVVMHSMITTILKAKDPRCRQNAAKWISTILVHTEFYWEAVTVTSEEIN